MPANTPSRADVRSVRVGKYLVVAHIATGGMGAVYKARDTENNRDVALKILAPQLASKAVMLERFRREARSAGKLTHPNIVTLYEFGEAQGAYYLAMEYVEGIDLQAYLNEKGPLDWRTAKLILFQAAQALHHAHKRGIVHRDVKPSNFLITRTDPPVVKMTDLGLAREVDEEEFRVTREGTTVGTVDYMSPEQARDSGAADVRSDLYSLGCTFYHMLAGHAPFAGGGLTERIFRHIGEQAQDIREINPRVPESLVFVLQKLLAKKPEDRFQTPKELLRALSTRGKLATPALPETIGLAPVDEPPAGGSDDRVLTGNELLQGLLDEGESAVEMPAVEAEEPVLPPSPASRVPRPQHHTDPPRRPPRPGKPQDTEDEESDPGDEEATREIPSSPSEPGPVGPPGWLVYSGIVVAVLVVLIGGSILIRSSLTARVTEDTSTEIAQGTGATTNQAEPPNWRTGRISPTGPTGPTGVTGATGRRPTPPRPPDPPDPPPFALVEPDAPRPDVAALRKSLLGAWDFPSPSADATSLRLTRLPSGTNDHTTLESAFAAAGREKANDAIISIHDNGPFFLSPASLTGKNVYLRAAPGFRPLIVWDPSVRGDEALVSVEGGQVVLEGLELVTRCQAGAPRVLAVVHARGGSAWLRDCVISATGAVPGVSVVGVRADGSADSERAVRVRLHRCHLRGQALGGVALKGGTTALLVDESLLSGGDVPLVAMTLRERGNLDLRVVRSTLVGRKTAVDLRFDPPDLLRGSWRVQCCDSVVSCHDADSEAALLRLTPDNPEAEKQWLSHNCVFAGWPLLLHAGERTIRTTQHRAWRTHWRMTFGDAATSETWPARLSKELGDESAEAFRTDVAVGAPVGYAALLGEGTIGCPPASLPPARAHWRTLTFEPFVYAPVALHSGEVPEIPDPGDGNYHGERIDVSTTDVGAYLTELFESGKQRPGPTVVIHLYRSNPLKDRPTSPLYVKGVNLVIYLEPTVRQDKPGERLVERQILNAQSTQRTKRAALIEVEGGSLDLIGGAIQYPNFNLALVPPHLIRVSGGNLRLHDCQLLGPIDAPTRSYRGLVQFQGKAGPLDKSPTCAISDSVLVSARTALEVSGAARVRLSNVVVVAGGEALLLRPEPGTQPAVSLERCTLAARQAVLHLHDLLKRPGTDTPAVVQSRQCAFVQPFGDRGGLLLAEGEALAHGSVVWQSDRDVYDRRLHFAWMLAPLPPAQAQPQDEMARLWGVGVKKPILDRPFVRTFTETDWPHAALVVPPPRGMAPTGLRPEHGADLWQLGLVKKDR